jgi:hypothetical protein
MKLVSTRIFFVASVAVAVAACDRGTPPPATPRAAATIANAPAAPPPPKLFTSADVDAKLRDEWTGAGVAPVARAGDATWLRRAWLDVLGTIPPPEVTVHFLADKGADKRARAVEEMLASPLWADHWTAYWDDVWMGRDTRMPQVDRGAFRAWLHDAFAHNEPWDRMVRELLTATGVNSEGGRQRDALANEGTGGAPACRTPEGSGREHENECVNGAVNWTLKYVQNPQDMAGAASRTLLGVQIQCAQCHDHKTEKWTQKDFQQFAAAFVRTRLVPLDGGKPMGQVKRIAVRDLDRAAPRFAKMGDTGPIVAAHPTALDGTDLAARANVREALAAWVTARDNPWFARAIVNRMWGHFLGRGFSDPVDDMRPSNPPVASAMLDALAADFVASGWDLKHLVRVVVGTEAYGLAAAPLADTTAKVDPESKLWERFRVTPLGPEELLNALVAATRLDGIVRATGRMDLDNVRFQVKQRYGFLFDVDEESDASDYEGTISQALALLDGGVVGSGARVLPGGALADVIAAPGDDASKIEALYVRTLSRFPTAEETSTWTKYVTDASAAPDPAPAAQPAPKPGNAGKGGKGKPDPLARLESRAPVTRETARVRAFEDVLWTLLNSSEFVLNH